MRLSAYLSSLTTLAAVVAALPTRRAITTPGLATVDLRLTGPDTTHYTVSNQISTTDQSQHLTVIVGQTLSLEHDPLHLQGLQIESITAGDSLSLLSSSVDVNDARVTCSARVEGRDGWLEFDIQDKGVLLAGGRLAKVTRLSCGMAGEAAR
ncbi:hypothetical protein E8E13_009238 [Curvularia kusanoi]|uniref:Uncharacterized protein n=1 Tax=Curvularia kusanoi TaxID=90978 RepID=A0A9P4THE3_CURKU|nr:hypothetical protein E8E13_009238 [Curvularia kusanoi]